MKALPSFTFRPGINAEAMTIVWNNPHGLAIIEESTVEVLLSRRWGSEVPDDVLEAWNALVEEGEDGKAADSEPELDLKMVATAPTPTAQTTIEPTPVAKAAEPEPKAEEPKAPAPKPAPEPAKATKPAATKEELLKRAEEEAAKAKDK